MGALAGGILAAAGSAQATTYYFVNDYCSGGCGASPSTPVGTVVTSLVSPGVVNIAVTLTNGGAFHDSNSGQQHLLVFDLSGVPTITFSHVPSPFTDGPGNVENTGTVSDDGAGTFDYVVNFPHETHPPDVTSFNFDISGTGLSLASFIANPRGNFFATDIWAGPGENGNTGDVGAVPAASPAPEPAAWALMMAGVGGLGATIRSRRQARAQAA